MILKGTIAFLCCLMLAIIWYIPPMDSVYWELIPITEEKYYHGFWRYLHRVKRFWVNWNLFYIRDLYLYGFRYWFKEIKRVTGICIIILLTYTGFLFYEINA
jgi:hypothetical protein